MIKISKIMIKQSRRKLAIALCLTGLSFSAFAEIYKWTDEQGNTHYSDIKPKNTSSQSLKIKTNTNTASATDPIQASKELSERNEADLEAKAKKLQEETQKRELEAQCEAIRDNIKTIEENSRIRITENNETRYLSPEEIAEKKAKFEADLAQFCKP